MKVHWLWVIVAFLGSAAWTGWGTLQLEESFELVKWAFVMAVFVLPPAVILACLLSTLYKGKRPKEQ